MVHHKGDDPIFVKNEFYRQRIVSVVALVLILSLFIVAISRPAREAQIVLVISDFLPSEETYTYKTMNFTTGDPYNGYSYWTYDVGTTTNAPSDNKYAMNTDASGEYAYFGFDEFVEHGVVRAEVIFETTLLAGTYHFQPLGYFYQKTDLESKTRWALVINWNSSGIGLYYNTGNGDTPISVNLNDTAPSLAVDYKCTLSNLGDQTFVEIQDISTFPTYPIIYSGFTTTENYDATSLYAGFGQYSTGSGNIYGWRDDFSIIDVTYTYPEGGNGFNRIDAYVDEVFTQRLYDLDAGFNRTLGISPTITNLTILVECWLNSTTHDISNVAEGRNIIRHSIAVSSPSNESVFFQQNFTYISGVDYGDNVFLYQYSVQLNFTPIAGIIYTAVIEYEIFDYYEVFD